MKKKICPSPFSELEITEDGHVYFCCAHRIQGLSIGNIFTEQFSNVWNSDIAIKIREEALSGTYKYCNKNYCHKISNENENHLHNYREEFKKEMTVYPKQIDFPLDKECNSKCIFCRDEFIKLNENEINDLRNKLQKIYIPMCKDLETFSLNAHGDPFASRFSQEVIKTIIENYPKIKFKITTNGIALTKEKIEELQLSDRIKELNISINSATKHTHRLIFRNNGYSHLIKNLEYVKHLYDNNKIDTLNFNFVVCKQNYREMIDFIKLSNKFGASPVLWEVRDYRNNALEHKHEEIAIHLSKDKFYRELKKILSNNIFNAGNVNLSPILKKIRNEAILEKELSILNKFLNLFIS